MPQGFGGARLRDSDKILVVSGVVGRLRPARTFVDGQYFDQLSVADPDGGEAHVLQGIFCTHRLLAPLGESGAKEIHIWNRHVFAVKNKAGLTEDIEGVKSSFLYRDRYLLLLLAGSVVMLPYALYIVVRKLSVVRFLPKIRNGHADAAA
jgi:hypothetical protein